MPDTPHKPGSSDPDPVELCVHSDECRTSLALIEREVRDHGRLLRKISDHFEDTKAGPSIVTRVDRIEQAAKLLKCIVAAAWVVISGLIIHALSLWVVGSKAHT